MSFEIGRLIKVDIHVGKMKPKNNCKETEANKKPVTFTRQSQAK